MQLTRLPNWPDLLAAFIEERRHMPFQWGQNDCATFAADAVLRLTGQDVLASLRGTWSTEGQALELAARMGGLSWAVRQLLGRPSAQPRRAARGSVVCARMLGVPIMGVHLGAHWCAPGAHGLEFRPAAEERLAWEV